MNKLKILASLTVLVFLISLSFSSAYFQVSSPSFRGSSSTSSFVRASDDYSDYSRYPVYSTNQFSNSNSFYKNLDSSSFTSSYTGPFASKTTTYNEYLKIRPRKTIRTISFAAAEKYFGETLDESYNKQNNNINTRSASFASNKDYDGGFSWRNREAFDSSRYNSNNYQTYYYQPNYDNNLGYYNWRY